MGQKSKTMLIVGIVIKIVVVVLLALLLFFAGRRAYSFGYRVFQEDTVSDPPGKKVAITLEEDISGEELAELLKSKGLIKDEKIFQVQYALSQYKGELKAGNYILNTSQTSDEMLEILSGVTETEQESE